MRITLESWKDAERDLREFGIRDAVYDENGFVQTITSNSGMNYELSPDIIKQLVASGTMEVKLGRRVTNR